MTPGADYPARRPTWWRRWNDLSAGSSAPSPRGFTETAWDDSGSGCDLAIATPAYQASLRIGCAGRAYADVSADGDPDTGLTVYASSDGGWIAAGGTSLAAPLIAAFEAITGVDGTTPAWAYADASMLDDPASGSNGSCSTALDVICRSAAGYDGPTGAGSISGAIMPGAPGIGAPDIRSSSASTFTDGVIGSAGAAAAGEELCRGRCRHRRAVTRRRLPERIGDELLVAVRHHHGLRSPHDGADDRRRHCPGRSQWHAQRSCAREDLPLPAGREQRLRDRVRL